MRSNTNLYNARMEKNDEYYTSYEDVKREIEHYRDQLSGKIVYCPCDDYRWSAFYKFFKDNYHDYGLREVRATNYDLGEGAFYARYGTFGEVVEQLQGDGDFRGLEATKIKDESDVVITNPPFSIARDFVEWVGGKDCLFICPKTFYIYKSVFPLFRDGLLKVGYRYGTMYFNGKPVPCGWFTSLDVEQKRLMLTAEYNKYDYPKYDNMDAVEVGCIKDIPKDYYGVIGVPATIMQYDLSDFDILAVACGNGWSSYREELELINYDTSVKYRGGMGCAVLDGKIKFTRILIKRKPILL